jgi:hypothetical protein
MWNRTILVLCLLAAAASLGGCKTIVNAIKPTPTVKHVSIEAKVGSPSASIQGTLKPGAPANLPLWDGAGVLKTKTSKSDMGNSWLATLTTADPFNVVVAGMATGFQNTGWQVESQDLSSAGASTTVITVSSSAADGVVTITSQKDNSTHIDYVMTTGK